MIRISTNDFPKIIVMIDLFIVAHLEVIVFNSETVLGRGFCGTWPVNAVVAMWRGHSTARGSNFFRRVSKLLKTERVLLHRILYRVFCYFGVTSLSYFSVAKCRWAKPTRR